VTDLEKAVKFEGGEIKEGAFSPEAIQLLNCMLAKKADDRKTAVDILKDPWWENKEDKVIGVARHVEFQCTRSRVRQILRNAVAAKLRYEHTATCFEIFQRYDPDRSGTISRAEFKQAWNELYQDSNGTNRDADEYFSNADVDKNDTLEFNEFAAITLDWRHVDENDLDDQLNDLLTQMGSVSRPEKGELEVDIKSFFKMFQEGLEKSDDLNLEEAIKEIDKDGDGFITIEELKAFVQGANALSHDRREEQAVEEEKKVEAGTEKRQSLTITDWAKTSTRMRGNTSQGFFLDQTELAGIVCEEDPL
jgi:Ca2+-binding EF-hand superfamily protein